MGRQRSVLDLHKGELGIVKEFKSNNVACKLLTIGIIPNSIISIIRRSPFGGAYCLRLGNTYVAVRAHEAANIIIE